MRMTFFTDFVSRLSSSDKYQPLSEEQDDKTHSPKRSFEQPTPSPIHIQLYGGEKVGITTILKQYASLESTIPDSPQTIQAHLKDHQVIIKDSKTNTDARNDVAILVIGIEEKFWSFNNDIVVNQDSLIKWSESKAPVKSVVFNKGDLIKNDKNRDKIISYGSILEDRYNAKYHIVSAKNTEGLDEVFESAVKAVIFKRIKDFQADRKNAAPVVNIEEASSQNCFPRLSFR